MEKENIKKIVLTGGPCAGKTTIFESIEKYLKEKDYYVITLNETATELIKSNIIPSYDKTLTLIFQDIIMKYQYIKERCAYNYAKSIAKNKKVIILCDRGIMDNFAYLDTYEEFERILSNNNLDELKILNDYDLVIDLVSTATLKPDSYELDGIRYETIDEATIKDKKTSTAWVHHSNLKIIKPTKDINKKKDIVLKEIEKYLNDIKREPYKELYQLDISSNLSIYNSNNSRLVNILKIYLNRNLVITEKKYRNSTIYTLNEGKYEKVISNEEVIKIISKNQIISKEQYREIDFVDKGNFYKIIEYNGKLYLECDKLVIDIPNNLVLLSKKDYVKSVILYNKKGVNLYGNI